MFCSNVVPTPGAAQEAEGFYLTYVGPPNLQPAIYFLALRGHVVFKGKDWANS